MIKKSLLFVATIASTSVFAATDTLTKLNHNNAELKETHKAFGDDYCYDEKNNLNIADTIRVVHGEQFLCYGKIGEWISVDYPKTYSGLSHGHVSNK